MNLQTLLVPLQKYRSTGSLDVEISGISCDSRKVSKGDLFVALPGLRVHAGHFVPQAEAAGAEAVLSDRDIATRLPVIIVDQPRLAMARLANRFYDSPSSRLKLFGVTGTNGKTTITFLLKSILEHASLRCGLLGTVQYTGPGFFKPSSLTTPDTPELQHMLAAMAAEKWEACAMEVSSHSLSQYRAAGCTFVASIFTNLTQDHLDYHHTMEEYFAAKLMLFNNETCETKIAVTNLDDPYGRRIADIRAKLGLPVVTYGFDEAADFCIATWNSTSRGSEIVIRSGAASNRMQTPLIARYNAYNIAAAVSAARSAGIAMEAIVEGIDRMEQVPGRLQRIDHGQPYLIIIDYAHTEDALRQLLATVRPYTEKRLIVLFGCGGERDRGKRPLMGQAAGELCDVVILTSDNPRSEDPVAILEEVRQGVERSGNRNYHVAPDRKDAIELAVKIARPGDTLILAGKGHENYQVVGDKKLHFDEREILAELLKS